MGEPTSCENCDVRESDIHLGEIQAIIVSEDERVGVIRCPRVDNRGSITHGRKKAKEVDAGKHPELRWKEELHQSLRV